MSKAEFGYFDDVRVSGRVVHTSPKGDFDTTAMEEAVQEVLRVAEPLGSWVLYEHVSDDAGFASIEIVKAFYVACVDAGCVGIGCHINSVFLDIIKNDLPKELPVPIFISGSAQEVDGFIDALLDELE